MRRIVTLSLVAFTLVVLVSGIRAFQGNGAASEPAAKAAAKYQCPMHPSYVSNKPGDCPICGMRLVPLDRAGDPTGAGRPRTPVTTPRRGSPTA